MVAEAVAVAGDVVAEVAVVAEATTMVTTAPH